ncbi:phosphatidate cytidylyltransferase [Bacillus solimangrovi]|uniref:Phosphatidate cytidylyltransferase n=1 Tax=Bacillus solimangrovi TaxID=1305675 RepID=A0A1E5LDZ8_9BACI|nr:phosphatidate cytidylyltransferase [Bacillus solimangrovi]OEH92325.1 phosphatidate cytidylyltransferase [Bacillus solimangrovi]
MKQRIITALVAGIIFLGIVVYGAMPFTILVYLLASVALYELLRMKNIQITSSLGFIGLLFLWLLMIKDDILYASPIVTFTKIELALIVVLVLLSITVLSKNRFTFDDVGFIILSVVYIGVGFYYFIETRERGLDYVIYALFVIWSTDTGAYFVGRSLGKRKLWPKISPNKTIEGSIGGIVFALLTAVIFQLVHPLHSSMMIVILITILASITGQIGDLVESAFKRHYVVKDSGTILPGHGGILDRFDSLLFVLPVLHFVHFI